MFIPWEYKIINITLGPVPLAASHDSTDLQLETYLNDLGLEGWELVNVIRVAQPNDDALYRFFLKRYRVED